MTLPLLILSITMSKRPHTLVTPKRQEVVSIVKKENSEIRERPRDKSVVDQSMSLRERKK